MVDGCLKAKSLGAAAPLQHLSLWAVWLYKAEPAGMRVHVCASHIWYSTPAQSVFLCLPGRISHLKYSGGCRNALINTVALQLPFLCIYEAEPSRFGPLTDLTMCWCGWGPRQLGKLLDNLFFVFVFLLNLSILQSFNIYISDSSWLQCQGQVFLSVHLTLLNTNGVNFKVSCQLFRYFNLLSFCCLGTSVLYHITKSLIYLTCMWRPPHPTHPTTADIIP